MISKNVLYHDMWIFTKIWTASFFQNDDLKKSRFHRYVDIFGNIDKKTIFKSDLKITYFSSKCGNLRIV